MSISDDRPAAAAPPTPPPSFVRRHPIIAGFGVLSGLSLFSALWPVSAIVISVAIAGHVTGLDRVAWSATRAVAARLARAVHSHRAFAPAPPSPAPGPPAPSAPQPSAPQPSGPRRDVHPPSAVAPRIRRESPARPAASHAPARARHPRNADHPMETRVDGRGM